MKKNYDLSALMTFAWEIFRNKAKKCPTFSEALKRAWKAFDVAEGNKARVNAKKAEMGISEPIHTWYGHYLNGRMVKHGEKCLFQVELETPENGIGKTYLTSFFGYSQTDTIENVEASERVG